MRRAERAFAIATLLLLAVAAALLWQMPAGIGLVLMRDALGPLQLEGVSGTLWQGRAAQARLFGERLGPVAWDLQRLPLLFGRTVGELRLEGPPLQGRAQLERAGDIVRIDGLQLTLPARVLEPALDIPALRLGGQVRVEIGHAELVAGFPRALAGTASWQDATVAGAAAATLGTLQARFAARRDGSIEGSLSDAGGPLALDGRFVAGIAGYSAEATLAARDGNPQVREVLNHIGRPLPDGRVLFTVQGGLVGAWR